MEDELNYASIKFNNKNVSLPKKLNEEDTIYADVQTKGSLPNQKSAEIQMEETIYVEVNAKGHVLKQSLASTERSALRLAQRGAVCLGTLCFLLVAAIIILCFHFGAEHSTMLSDYANLTSDNHLLKSEKVELERRNLELSRDRDGLNWTLEFIFQFQNFPVNGYCPKKTKNTTERQCKPCLDGWTLFRSSCYQFPYGWDAWDDSRKNCQNENADLVVIGSQDEQEFISNHIQSYYDEYHGYWIGLRYSSKHGRWLWVDGSNLTAGYWVTGEAGNGRSVLAIPQSPQRPSITASANWFRPWSTMKNRWICETKAFIPPGGASDQAD